MNLRFFGLVLITLFAMGAGQASASTCTGEVTGNGSKTLPAVDIGTIGSGCQIGPYSTHQGQNGSNIPTVNATDNPSIYQFEWGGGNLSIQEEVGNNGLGYNIFIELGLSTVTVNSDGSLSSPLVSTQIAYQSGPTAPMYVIDNMYLASGTYLLDTFLGTCGATSCSKDPQITDPQYQVLFTPGPAGAPGEAPLPAALPLFGTGLGALALFASSRKRKKVATV
jgi:hypothetical protein